jgi:hypothetical protein
MWRAIRYLYSELKFPQVGFGEFQSALAGDVQLVAGRDEIEIISSEEPAWIAVLLPKQSADFGCMENNRAVRRPPDIWRDPPRSDDPARVLDEFARKQFARVSRRVGVSKELIAVHRRSVSFRPQQATHEAVVVGQKKSTVRRRHAERRLENERSIAVASHVDDADITKSECGMFIKDRC